MPVQAETGEEAAVGRCLREMALLLRPAGGGCWLSRPLQRKLLALVHCPLTAAEGRARAARAARSLGERCALELLLQHHHQQQQGGGGQQLSAALWAAVRARGCQFLGPHMQEEVLRLVLLALEDGSPLSRKVLVLFVVQRLAPHFPQASKTSIGHVVQLLYRASCFKVSKREGDSSLMQLREEFCSYEALRREHDAQIVQIASEAGLRIAPEQWSSLLYGDAAHRSHMQSLVDKLQSPQSFAQSLHELTLALQRTGDPAGLAALRPHFDRLLAYPCGESPPSWAELGRCVGAARACLQGVVSFLGRRGAEGGAGPVAGGPRYKTSLCRDVAQRGSCPRGAHCTFAHSQEEMDRHRARRAPRTDSKPALFSETRIVTNSRCREVSSSSPPCQPPAAAVPESPPPPAQGSPRDRLEAAPPAPCVPFQEDEDDWGSSSHGSSCDSSSSSHHPTRPCPSEEDPLVPFDPPLVSKYGPISRCARALVRGPAPIQVTSRQPQELTSPTAALRLPLASAAAAPSLFAAPLAGVGQLLQPVARPTATDPQQAAALLTSAADMLAAPRWTLVPGGGEAEEPPPPLVVPVKSPFLLPPLLPAALAAAAPPTRGSESWAGQPQVPTSVGPWLLNQLEEPACADACWTHQPPPGGH